MARRIAVVLSQGQSQNPAKRKLEEDLACALMLEPNVDVTIIPHLYDLKSDGTGVLCLQGISGDLILLSWLYERAARWTLARHGIQGQAGISLLKLEEDEEDDFSSEDVTEEEAIDRVIDQLEIPNRKIYCLDLRSATSIEPYVEEINRIVAEANTQVMELDLGGPLTGANSDKTSADKNGSPIIAEQKPHKIDEAAPRRWYPIIDYSRCTNCMECIDFCLFGVYGVDGAENILVEQPDDCRKGCPACSRVCPENAIIFPQHKTPVIAGSIEAGGAGALKIDLSKLFGAPETNESAAQAAARERDEQLKLAGRQAVGMSVGMNAAMPKRQAENQTRPKDELDDLVDQLDEFDL